MDKMNDTIRPSRKDPSKLETLSACNTGQLQCAACDSGSDSVFDLMKEPKALERMATEKTELVFKPGQHIFYEGNQPSGVYCISSGSVKLESITENGNAHLIKICRAGDVLGHRALFAGEVFRASAVAVETTKVCFIPKNVLDQVLSLDQKISANFLKRLAEEIGDLTVRYFHATDLSAVERVAEALLYLKENVGESVKISRKEIAEFAGTTPETVMRTLAKFEKDGLIKLVGRRIEIINRKQLLKSAKIYV